MSTVLIAVVFVVILGSFVQGVMGFGSGMTCMALLPFFMPMSDVVAVIAVVCLFINIRLLAALWSSIRWRSLLFLGIGAMGGVPLGVYVLKNLDEGQLKIGLGLLMLLYTVVKLSPLDLLRRTLPDRWGLLFGSIGGAFGASSNVGGPPLIIYATMKDWGKDETKATLQAYFVPLALVVWIGHGVSGHGVSPSPMVEKSQCRLTAPGLSTVARDNPPGLVACAIAPLVQS